MTDEAKTPKPEDDAGQEHSDWASEAEAALEGVGTALREAWEASRGARLNALESAKKAAQQLGEAIDQGVAAAREKWESQSGPSAGPATEDAPEDGAPRHTPQMSPDEGRADTD